MIDFVPPIIRVDDFTAVLAEKFLHVGNAALRAVTLSAFWRLAPYAIAIGCVLASVYIAPIVAIATTTTPIAAICTAATAAIIAGVPFPMEIRRIASMILASEARH